MKKTIAILTCLLVLVSCAALAGCGKQDLTNSKYLGTWVATKATAFDEEVAIDEAVPGGMKLKLNPDGTATVTSEDEVSNCTWKETSKGVKFSGDMKTKANAEGKELVMKIIGVKLYFTKLSDAAEAVDDLGDALSDAADSAIDEAASGIASIVDSVTTE